jgi:glycosyltransferase involved in cell wall biosynthesis
MEMMNVLHLTGHLAPGGAEKIAVLTANELAKRPDMNVHYCYIRDLHLDLLADLDDRINVFTIKRQGRFDLQAILRLKRKIQELGIDIVHAHNTTVYIAIAASAGTKAKVVWHDHLGETDTQLHLRKDIFYRFVFKRLGGYIGVNHKLVNWASHFTSNAVIRYVPNFSQNLHTEEQFPDKLEGTRDNRLVSLAHFRRQKNHLNFIDALGILKEDGVECYAYMAGGLYDDAYVGEINARIRQYGLEDRAFILGLVRNTGALLGQCAIGVISSDSEGLPLSLIEYGLNGLVPVCTRVGQCEEVLGFGKYGSLVDPGSPEQLAKAIADLLKNKASLETKSHAYAAFIRATYSAEGFINSICEIYREVHS